MSASESQFTWFDWLLALVATGALVVLGLSYMSPRRPSGPDLSQLASQVEGKTLPSIPYASRAGTVDSLSFATSRRTLVLVFQPTCPVCNANAQNWALLGDTVRSMPGARVLAAGPVDSISTAQRWLDGHHVRADELVVPTEPAGFNAVWHVFGVPATYVVDSGGAILLARFGRLSAADRSALISAMQSTP